MDVITLYSTSTRYDNATTTVYIMPQKLDPIIDTGSSEVCLLVSMADGIALGLSLGWIPLGHLLLAIPGFAADFSKPCL